MWAIISEGGRERERERGRRRGREREGEGEEEKKVEGYQNANEPETLSYQATKRKKKKKKKDYWMKKLLQKGGGGGRKKSEETGEDELTNDRDHDEVDLFRLEGRVTLVDDQVDGCDNLEGEAECGGGHDRDLTGIINSRCWGG